MKTLIEWWQRSQSQLFLALSFIWPVVLYFSIPCRPVYMAGVYIFIVTGLIIFVKNKYREAIRLPDIPKLEIPDKKRKKEKADAPALGLQEILLEEFEYIKETAAQAMNDRHTLVNYFLLSAGVVLASFGLMVSEEGGARFPYRYEVLIGLNLLFNLVGWVYFMQVVRLRQAWCESARAMSHIKQVFAKNSLYSSETAKPSFRWNIESIPQAEKKMTVFYFSALLISILNAAAIALSSIILLNFDVLRQAEELHQHLHIPYGYPLLGLGLGLYHLVFQMSMYTALLEES
jgi:hypothetical protein